MKSNMKERRKKTRSRNTVRMKGSAATTLLKKLIWMDESRRKAPTRTIVQPRAREKDTIKP